MRPEGVGSILLIVALALAVLGFVVEVIDGHVVIGTLSAVFVAGAAVDYHRFRTQPDSPKNRDLVHRLVLYVALLALMHNTGLDTVEGWITGN